MRLEQIVTTLLAGSPEGLTTRSEYRELLRYASSEVIPVLKRQASTAQPDTLAALLKALGQISPMWQAGTRQIRLSSGSPFGSQYRYSPPGAPQSGMGMCTGEPKRVNIPLSDSPSERVPDTIYGRARPGLGMPVPVVSHLGATAFQSPVTAIKMDQKVLVHDIGDPARLNTETEEDNLIFHDVHNCIRLEEDDPDIRLYGVHLQIPTLDEYKKLRRPSMEASERGDKVTASRLSLKGAKLLLQWNKHQQWSGDFFIRLIYYGTDKAHDLATRNNPIAAAEYFVSALELSLSPRVSNRERFRALVESARNHALLYYLWTTVNQVQGMEGDIGPGTEEMQYVKQVYATSGNKTLQRTFLQALLRLADLDWNLARRCLRDDHLNHMIGTQAAGVLRGILGDLSPSDLSDHEEVLERLRGVRRERLGVLRSILVTLRSGRALNDFVGAVDGLDRALDGARPFLSSREEMLCQKLSLVLRRVTRVSSAPFVQLLRDTRERRSLEQEILRETERWPSTISCCWILPALRNVTTIADTDFDAVSKGRKAEVEVTLPLRAIPFSQPSRWGETAERSEIVIPLTLVNTGEVTAKQVQVVVSLGERKSRSEVEVTSKPIFVPELDPRETSFEVVRVKVAEGIRRFQLECQLSFMDGFRGTTQLKTVGLVTVSDAPFCSALSVKPNPYVLQAVSDRAHLIGRNLSDFLNQLEDQAFPPTLLFGQKRVGKSSIAKVLCSETHKNFADHVVPVYILMGELYRNTSLVLEDQFESHPPDRQLQQPSWEGLSGERRLFDLLDFLARSYKRRLLVVLDEFDDWLMDTSRRFEHSRGQVLSGLRTFTMRSNMYFMFVGGEHLPALMTPEAGERLNNAVRVRVTYLGELALKKLVRAPWVDKGPGERMEFTEEAVDHIYELTSGNPYWAKKICHALFTRAKREGVVNILPHHVELVARELLQSTHIGSFNHLWLNSPKVYSLFRELVIRQKDIYDSYVPMVVLRSALSSEEMAQGWWDEVITQLREGEIIEKSQDSESYKAKLQLAARFVTSNGPYQLSQEEAQQNEPGV